MNKKLFHFFREFVAKGTFPKEGFLCLVNLTFDRETLKTLEGTLDKFDRFALTVSKNTLWGRSVFPKSKKQKKVSDIRQKNSTPFVVRNFYDSVALLWGKQRFQKVPPSLNLLRRAETFGVLAFLFRQVCQNFIRRVLTTVLRKDFILAKVFYFGLLSVFEENFTDNCLKASQHACQSCILFAPNDFLRTKKTFIRDNEVLFFFRSCDNFFDF